MGNRLLMPVKFSVLYYTNVTDVGFNIPFPTPSKCLNTVLSIGRCQWPKEGKFLPSICGRCVFSSLLVLSVKWTVNLERVHDPQEHVLDKMAEGKEDKLQGFPEAFQSVICCMATAKEMAMRNDITCARPWTQVCYICTMYCLQFRWYE